MKHLSLAALTLTLLAGCGSYPSGGSSMSSSYGPGAPGAPATASAGAGASMGATPAMMKNGMLVNSQGLTLYVFDKDVANSGKSVCNGQCVNLWPPLLAADSDVPSGDYSIVVRDDGKKQWAYKGKPLYRWAADQAPGDKNGDNYLKIWHIVSQ